MTGIHVLLNLCLGDMLDVGATRIKHSHFGGIRVEASDSVSCFRESQRERQADISTTDDANLELRTLKKLRLPVNWHKYLHAPSRSYSNLEKRDYSKIKR